jgi:hypothetical protein
MNDSSEDPLQTKFRAQEAQRLADVDALTAKRNLRIEAIRLEASDPARVLAACYDINDALNDLGTRFLALQESVSLMQSEVRALTVATVKDRAPKVEAPTEAMMARLLAIQDDYEARLRALEEDLRVRIVSEPRRGDNRGEQAGDY